MEEGSSVVRYVDQILLDAIHCGASDIHFELYEFQFRVRYRRDGLLHTVARLSVNRAKYLISRIKVLANLDISERRLPQDGRFKFVVSPEHMVDFRVSSCPTLYGEKVVVRVLNAEHALPKLADLGMTLVQQKLFLQSIFCSHGLILVCGSTGSGKTVTLYTALQQLNVEEKNISTVEDPIEIPLEGINQVPINVKAGLNFSTALRSFMRQDPDVIMIGEIRDLETAEIAVKSAQTGHLILSTLHTKSAPEAMRRLMNLGISPLNLASSLTLVVAQCLVRKLCLHCKMEAHYPNEILLREGFDQKELPSLTLYQAVGCENCFRGYKGRIGLFQIMPVSQTMSESIFQEHSVAMMAELAEQENIWTVRKAGLEKVREGVTSLEELNNVNST